MDLITHIALLRGINVGGRQLAAMADLRAMLATLNFTNPRSLLQSGNLIFQCAPTPTPELEALLESQAEARLGLRTAFMVRTAAEWREIVAANPFTREARDDPARLVAMAFKQTLAAQAVRTLRAAIVDRETLEARGRELYVVYPDGMGNSRLTTALIDRTLGQRGTARNWNTVMKLAALVQG
ncbi:MAG TPA: DUF1697 domain-containing protein [Caulobacteraceae bacterium]